MLTKIQPKSYTEMFFDMIESADDQTGKITYKLPKETMEKLEQLCRLELGKELDGSDMSEAEPPRLSLAERIKTTKDCIDYYTQELKNPHRWGLDQLAYFEIMLAEAKRDLEKLKKREYWLKHPRQKDSVDVEALKQSHDLVEVAESYGLKLRKRGQEYWAACPFHQEKTPSFSINQEKQVFSCFGCQESGDLIDFIRKMRGCDFKEALEVLR